MKQLLIKSGLVLCLSVCSAQAGMPPIQYLRICELEGVNALFVGSDVPSTIDDTFPLCLNQGTGMIAQDTPSGNLTFSQSAFANRVLALENQLDILEMSLGLDTHEQLVVSNQQHEMFESRSATVEYTKICEAGNLRGIQYLPLTNQCLDPTTGIIAVDTVDGPVYSQTPLATRVLNLELRMNRVQAVME